VINDSQSIRKQAMSAIKLFETKQVRSLWDAEKEAWFFSIVDVIAVLTDSLNPRTFWSVLKNRLKKEGSELATNCSQLKMKSADGKNYLTDEWENRGVQKGQEFAILTDEITKAWSGISKEKLPQGFEQSRKIAKQGGTIAGNTRKEIELKTGKAIVEKGSVPFCVLMATFAQKQPESPNEGANEGASGGANGGTNGGASGGANGLLSYIQAHPGQRSNEMVVALNTPLRSIERWLKQLKANGLIEFRGASKTGGYHATAAKPAPPGVKG